MLQGYRLFLGGTAIALLSLATGCSDLEQTLGLSSPDPSPVAAPVAPSPAVAIATPQATPTVPPAETWKQAQEQATSAARLAQSAQSRDDWSLVASRWQQAIALVQRIPQDTPEHAQAQRKRAEYQNNLAIARQRANATTPDVASFSEPAPATPAAETASTPPAENAPATDASPAANPAAPNAPAQSPEVALAAHLNQIGARMYATYWCGYCRRQQEMFGPEAVQRLTIIECDPRGQNAQPQVCRQAGVAGFPTWEINGQQYPGMFSLERLAELSGYTGPRDFGG